jgi:hypothetical protein
VIHNFAWLNNLIAKLFIPVNIYMALTSIKSVLTTSYKS